jgi:hypothetical protein
MLPLKTQKQLQKILQVLLFESISKGVGVNEDLNVCCY